MPTSKLVSTITGYPVQPNKAVVGANAFAHESGIHQDGVLKHRETYEIMRAEDVGWGANRLTLGKLSGRNAFRTRLAELGITLASEEALNAAFAKFKELADKKREIFDEDLQALVSDESVTPEQERFKLVSLVAHSETGEQPYRARGDRRRRSRDALPRRAAPASSTPRSRRSSSMVHSGTELLLYSVNNITDRHRLAGGGDGAPGEGGPRRERDGRRHRHRRRFRQGLPERAQQDGRSAPRA